MRIKIRVKLTLLLIGVALIPLLATVAIVIVRLQGIERANAIAIESEISRAAIEEIGAFVTSQFGVISSIEYIFPEFFRMGGSADTILERILFTNDSFTDISVVDAGGMELNRKNHILVIRTIDLADRSGTEEFLAVKNETRYIGPVILDRGKPVFTIGEAIISPRGEFEGAVFAKIDARVMHDVVRRASSVGERGMVYAVDAEGAVIAHPDVSQVLREKDLSGIRIVSKLLTGGANSVLLESYEGELGVEVLGVGSPMILSFKDISGSTLETGWFIIAERPTSVVFAGVSEITRFVLAILLIVLFISMVAAFIFSRRIIRPIESVHRGLAQFSKGNLGYRVAVQTNDEIADLAEGFNSMAGKLNSSIVQLKDERTIIAAEKNKLSVVLSGMSDGVIAVDLDTRIITFNKAAETMTGLSQKSILGKKIGEFLKVFENDNELPVSQYCPTKKGSVEGPVFARNNLRVESLKGGEVYVNIVSGHIKEGGSVNLGCIMTLHDTTRESLIERLKSEFVTIAAHQLRTPLSTIKWSLSMANDAKDPSEVKSYIDKSYKSNDRMIQLVNDLLNAARIEEGRIISKPEMVDVSSIVQWVLGLESDNIKRKSIKLDYSGPGGELLNVWGDSDAIKLAFQNIFLNAIKYTPKGGAIDVKIKKLGQKMEVSVKDTGIGIPEDQQISVFSKFFRAGNAMRLDTEGSGLGLFIAKNIIKAHGGKVWFESEENEGTSFYFTLPISKKKIKP